MAQEIAMMVLVRLGIMSGFLSRIGTLEAAALLSGSQDG
jgi:hypothetical protein